MQLTHLMSATHAAPPPDASAADVLENGLGYWIPSGASTHQLGGLGYARWALEITERECQMGIFFDVIVVAVMSGSTLAGMATGFKLARKIGRQQSGVATEEEARRPRRIVGVAAGPKKDGELADLVLSIMHTTAPKVGLEEGDVTRNDFEIDERWHGDCYGRLDERTHEHIKLAASLEGLVTDPVYSGKALTGLCEMVRAGELQGNILFVHTGGVLSVSAYSDLR